MLIPLRRVEQQRDAGDELRADDAPVGEGDDAPLLPDDDLTFERIRVELEKELAASDGDSAYDREYHFGSMI